LLKQIVIAVVFGAVVAVQNNRPERKVEGNVITSKRDPSVRIRLPTSAQYVGADRWVLYGIADCELHAFVDAEEHKSVRRLYWVQFEGYLPTQPNLKHTYDSPRHATIGGMDFYVDTWVRASAPETKPDSDGAHVRALIRAKGYASPAGMMYVRLVHLLDEQKRKELMIIYGEDLASTGFSAADLAKGGKAYDQWPTVEKGLIERAISKIALEQTPPRPPGAEL